MKIKEGTLSKCELRRPVNFSCVFLSGIVRPVVVFVRAVFLWTDYLRPLSYNSISDFDSCVIAFMNSKHSLVLVLESPILVVIEED